MPDAIGFRAVTAETETVLVEVKVSRGDFLADARKPHRAVGNGVGLFRYYMCPAGLISPDEVPERWGLLWVDQRGRIEPKLGPVALSKNSGTFAKACEPWKHQRNLARETWMLVRVMARIDDPDKVKRTINQAIREKERLVKLCNAQADEIRALKAPPSTSANIEELQVTIRSKVRSSSDRLHPERRTIDRCALGD
ncbi:TPA: hypothetical protein MXR76_002063 [Pseudomonas aeruginosa]|uniref:hypothetical protein n=1 Tax=Pseudomonas aeruginosa TaxID=287 RepID=UPI001160EBBA|nr:hypothetical protein [Pseudomonas aeruginosa]EKF7417516.1 hypothetical protein [Pseudomonas aeruginosa]HBO1619773.1 hypothetical protein [Pseudomonas aeruginosa]HCA5864586.1 hypothetical protein [Pseudomonas aeruginosa]HCA7773074.1 hypothetical protein [Pseudomonas aeruginosa]